MKIRYSTPNELDITGSTESWSHWRQELLDMLHKGRAITILDGDVTEDRAPYDICLSGLIIRLSDSKIRFRVDSRKLILEADRDHIMNFADNIPWDVEANESQVPYHIHFDKIGYDHFFEDDSLDVVLTSVSDLYRSQKL